MSLYKRGNVYWSALWIDGVRHMRSLETTNRRQAETLEQRWRDELHAKRFQLQNLKPEMPFGELYARFLAEGDVKPHHLDRAKQFLPFFSGTPIGRITKNDIARYRKHRQAEHLERLGEDDPKPLSETTINRDIEVIRHRIDVYEEQTQPLLNFYPRGKIFRVNATRPLELVTADILNVIQTVKRDW